MSTVDEVEGVTATPPSSPAGPSASGGPAAAASGGPAGVRPRRRRRWLGLIAVAAVVGGVATGAGLAFERTAAPADPPPLGPGDVAIELGIEHSLFEAGTIRVYEGTRVRFVLDNGDPIGHELIVGGPDVHAVHTSGTHAQHGSVAGEVSVGPNDRAMTTFQFDDPGEVEFACHLPGHYEYGMHGTIEVVARP